MSGYSAYCSRCDTGICTHQNDCMNKLEAEVARLRAALEEIAKSDNCECDRYGVRRQDWCAVRIARAALEGKP